MSKITDDISYSPGETVKYFVANKILYTLRKGDDGFWRDKWGVIYALTDTTASIDTDTRCGVGFFSLPDWHIFHELNIDICGKHDYYYDCPVYQLYHTREEADNWLRDAEEIDNPTFVGKVIGNTLRWLARQFGGKYWENNKTR